MNSVYTLIQNSIMEHPNKREYPNCGLTNAFMTDLRFSKLIKLDNWANALGFYVNAQ